MIFFFFCLNPQDLVTGVWWREGGGWRSGGWFPGLWPGSLCEQWYDVEHGERSRCRVDGATSLGCVCGTMGKAFCLEMGLQVRWFQNIQERAWSLDVVLLVSTRWIVGQNRANWPWQPFSAEPLCRESLLLSVPPCPG